MGDAFAERVEHQGVGNQTAPFHDFLDPLAKLCISMDVVPQNCFQ